MDCDICSVYYRRMTPLTLLNQSRKPRERVWRDGAASLGLEDLLALIIGSGTSYRPVLELAKEVAAVLLSGTSEPSDLAAVSGIGQAKAAELAAALQLADSLHERRSRQRLDAPELVYQLCRDLTEQLQEHVAVLYLTVRNGLIAREIISIGTATASLLHPREVFRPAITRNASHIVLVHTHPSGDSSPSSADREVTRRMTVAGQQLGIELVDHIICAKDTFYSFRRECPSMLVS